MSQRLRVYLPSLSAGPRRLPAETAHYVARVHRLGNGARFMAFDPEEALEAEAVIVETSGGQVTCELRAPERALRVGALSVTLFAAPGKGERFEEVVRAATALGVRALHLVKSERSVFVPRDRHRDRLRAIAIDGARQSGRGDLPTISGPTPLADAIRATRAPLRLCLHPRAPESLHALLGAWTPADEAAVLVGPEGGFSEPELTAVRDAGWLLGALGPFTLRAELAAIVALGCFASRAPGAPPEETVPQ